MLITELKGKVEFYVDAMFQAGYDRGWNQVLVELDEMSNREWNLGNRVTAEVIRKVINQLGEGNDEI